MGFPCGKDQYVVIDPEELDQLRSAEEKRAIRIDTFVGQQQLSPLYYSDRHYYLLPDGATAEASYRVLQRAMAERGVEAIGQVVLSKREQLVLVRPLEALLCMTVLKYAAQVRLPETFADQLPPADIPGQELELAQMLIDSRSSRELDYGRYQDAYAQKLAQLVEAKVQGKALVAPPAGEPRMIVNLLEALQASVAEASGRANAKAASKALAGQLSRKAKTAGKRGSKRSAVRKTRKKKTA
jgi:DNA end-binding protein Ku